MSGFKVLEYIDRKEEENPKKFWMITYLIVFIAPLFLAAGLYFLLEIFKFPTTLDDDTTRYLLSAFIQSLAAIIAIVVSLTLVAIQFTASEYSSRVIEVFKKNPAMWAIIGGYISGISVFAFILMSIYDLEAVSGVKSGAVFYSFFLFIALLVTLIPHIRITLNHMNAEKVIDNLFDDLNLEKLIELQPKDDPFHDLFVIINSSAIKGDMVTFSYGLKRIREKFIDVTNNSDPKLDLNYICSRFCDDVKRTSLILFEKREEKFLFDIINSLKIMLDVSYDDKSGPNYIIYNEIIPLLSEIGSKAIDEKYVTVHDKCFTTMVEMLKKLSIFYYYSNNESVLDLILEILSSITGFGYHFMKNNDNQNFSVIPVLRYTALNELKEKKISILIKIDTIFVDYCKKLVYIYMRSPECQKSKFYLDPIKQIASYAKNTNFSDDIKKIALSALEIIGKDAYRKYNLPEITILINRELFDLGLYFMKNSNSELNNIVVNYLAKLHFLCDGLEEIENDFKYRFAYSSGVYVGEKELQYRERLICTDMINTLERPHSCSEEGAEYMNTRIYIE